MEIGKGLNTPEVIDYRKYTGPVLAREFCFLLNQVLIKTPDVLPEAKNATSSHIRSSLPLSTIVNRVNALCFLRVEGNQARMPETLVFKPEAFSPKYLPLRGYGNHLEPQDPLVCISGLDAPVTAKLCLQPIRELLGIS